MLIALIVIVTYLIGMLFYLAWMENEIYNPPHIPETEAEKNVRKIKLRIADVEWRIKRQNAEFHNSNTSDSHADFRNKFKRTNI